MSRYSLRFVVLSLLLILVSDVFIKPCLADTSQSDRQAINTAIVQNLSFPGMPADAKPRVDHLASVGDYAITDWLMADGGGEDVLQRVDGHWTILTGGGGAMETPDLIQAGVPESTANQLIQQLQAQW